MSLPPTHCSCLAGSLQRTGPSSRHLLRAAIMMAGAAAAVAVAAAPAGFQLQRAQCRAATALAATSNGAGVMPAEQFSLLRITGDGRCLFRSLAQGSHLAAQEDAAGASADSGGGSGAGSGETQQQQSLYVQQQMKLLSAEVETARADELRQAICEELLQRRWAVPAPGPASAACYRATVAAASGALVAAILPLTRAPTAAFAN